MAYLLIDYVGQNGTSWKHERGLNTTSNQNMNSSFHFSPFIVSDMSMSRVIKEMSTTIKKHSKDQIKDMIRTTTQLINELSEKTEKDACKLL